MAPFLSIQRFSAGRSRARTRRAQHGLVQSIRPAPILRPPRPQLGRHAHESESNERVRVCQKDFASLSNLQVQHNMGRPMLAKHSVSLSSGQAVRIRLFVELSARSLHVRLELRGGRESRRSRAARLSSRVPQRERAGLSRHLRRIRQGNNNLNSSFS